MGLLAKRRENKTKLAHAKRRVAELLPLCERTTGRKLKKPFTIERSSRLRHTWRYLIDRLSVMFNKSRVWTGTSYFGSGKNHNQLLAYYYPNRRILGFNLTYYLPGDKFDYIICHELVHMLMAQDTAFSRMLGKMTVEARRMLNEGTATYYGELTVRLYNPYFRLPESFISDHYGYDFFRKVASELGDPLGVLDSNPPPLLNGLLNPDGYIRELQA